MSDSTVAAVTRPTGWRAALVVLASLLAVLFLVVAGFRVISSGSLPSSHRDGSSSQDRADAITMAARTATVAFLDVDYRDMGPRVQRMISLSTGSFLAQYRGSSATLTATATEGKAISSGVVRAIGIDQMTATRAVVHVAADGNVSNIAIQQAEQAGKTVENQRAYRLQLTLTLVGGSWLLSDLQFVS